MLRLALFTSAFALLLGASLPAAAGDAKIYTSASCSETGYTSNLYRSPLGFLNPRGSSLRGIACPILRQHWNRGLRYAHAHVRGGGVVCFISRRTATGAILIGKAAKSWSAGSSTLGLPGFAFNDAFDTYTLVCTLPENTRFESYRVSE